jgi:hypothetical protein
MKNLILAIVLGLFMMSCEKENYQKISSISEIDTVEFTDVIIKNSSTLDSVEVYVTLQSTESIIGLFGMDSTNIHQICMNVVEGDTTYVPCIGKFWAIEDSIYHLGVTKPVMGAIVTFGTMNMQCKAAIEKGYTTGINNWEFTVNCFNKKLNPSATGGNESFDITLVDGLHCYIRQSVIAPVGSGSSNWTYGDQIPFIKSKNTWPMASNVDIPGVYPYGCDLCYESKNPPKPLCFQIKCSDKYTGTNICQTNRAGQGGQIICEFLGWVPQPLK